MDRHAILELVGYAASALIAVSLMMSSILRLRIINMTGAAAFATYGYFIGATPVAVLNGSIVLVNIYHITRMLKAKEYFRLLKLRPDSDYLRYFLGFYAKDILRVLPEFEYRPTERQVTLFILRDCAPIGVFIAEERPGGVLRVVLDFVIPHYRDLKVGKFLFVEQAEFFRERGIREIIIAPRTKEFGEYLVKVGFEPAGRNQDSLRIRFAEKHD
jgi:GNAT superfamily N-acetyltransferase